MSKSGYSTNRLYMFKDLFKSTLYGKVGTKKHYGDTTYYFEKNDASRNAIRLRREIRLDHGLRVK